MRTCPPRVFESAQLSFDIALRSALERIVTASGPGFGDWQWRLATLPFAFGGLGIYSAGDVLNYAFIASRLQSDTLQTKLLRHVGIIASGSTFDEALCVFNNAMKIDFLSNPSEVAAPKLMKKMADIYFTQVAKDAKSSFSLSPRQMALWQSQREDHTSDWLRVVPISGLGQTMNGKTYRSVLCYRLGVPLFLVSMPCSACSKVFTGDIYGDHAVSCAVLLYQAYDITPPYVLADSVTLFMGRRAWCRKRVSSMTKCSNIGPGGFLPFSFSSLGELEADAVTLLKRIRKFSIAQDIGARAAIHIFNRISFAIAKVASLLVNGSPSDEFHIHRGLKQGDPLSPFLFILVMEALHLSVCKAVDEDVFKGIQLQGSLALSHLFYADDAFFMGEWSDNNLRGIINILKCFHLASGLQINIHKSQILGVGVSRSRVEDMASSLGCTIMENKFRYLGVMVGAGMTRHKAWDDVILKLQSRLSKWKAKTLSIGGRLTLLKSVLGASPLYNMSIFKVPKGVLKVMESIRSNFFKGASMLEKKISWIAWDKVLASKKKGGLGVSSYFALNRALLLKWVWRFVSQDDSLWFRVIQAVHGDKIDSHSVRKVSIWSSILKEVQVLKSSGFDFLSYCSKRIGDGQSTSFWKETWMGDIPLCELCPRLFALDSAPNICVAAKMAGPLDTSFRRSVRGGVEQQEFSDLSSFLNSVVLSTSNDRWYFSLSSSGEFSVKDTRLAIDDLVLPSHSEPTRWVKLIPIKINVFMWRARRGCLPTRYNLVQKGVILESTSCPVCFSDEEDVHHLLFRCSLSQEVLHRVCRWWEIDFQLWRSFSEWDEWFSSIRLPGSVKGFLEGVFYVAWWFIWGFRNRSTFDVNKPSRSILFENIVSSSFLWCNSRCSRKFSRDDWLKNPHLISL
ncbi:RNA-directed DNA polymerase, eukaryota [Tanacetum coccineum]|uniref:RNA-directed DNA polymerase, eukaryota n=2 Tax=Tanacetum coccineum TaxID=301880 RepID=A0ABQ5F182_9ASTR